MKLTTMLRTALLLAVLFAATLAAPAAELREQISIPLLETRLRSYTNAIVLSISGTDIHIRHEDGVGNILLEDLDQKARRQLGLEPGEADAPPQAAITNMADLLALRNPGAVQAIDPAEILKGLGLTMGLLAVVAAIGLVCYIFTCYCYKRISLNAGHDPGFLIWIPILQMIPLLRAAQMSPWWLLGLIIPLVNLVVVILWCFKIVAACGKSVVWAILLILPFTNIIAFLYLAFSGGGGAARPPQMPQAG